MTQQNEEDNVDSSVQVSREGNTSNSFSSTPVFARKNVLDDEVFATYQPNTYDKQQSLSFKSPSDTGRDNVSIANSEVILRRPQIDRHRSEGSRGSWTPSLKHSHSSSDLIRVKQGYGRIKEPRSMILPISPGSKSVSPYLFGFPPPDGISLTGPHYNSNSNITAPVTPQDQFSPCVPIQGAEFYPNGTGYQNDCFSNEIHVVADRRPLSTIASTNSHPKLPTPPEVKKKMFTDILTTSLSTIYAILIITLGVSFYVVDALKVEYGDTHYLAEGFSLALLGIALIYLLSLNIDITIYNHRKRKFEKMIERIQPEDIEMKATSDGVAYDATLQKALNLSKQLDHRYCFNKDRHSSNFYLKIGAAGFCFGHLIHSFLILTYRGVILNSDNDASGECLSVLTFIIEILYPIYSVVLLFFIFKYSNVIINKNRDFHRFGFMHCLASSLCFWLWTIFRETAEYIQNSQYKDSKKNTNGTVGLLNYDNPNDGVHQNLQVIVPFRFTAICEHDEMNVVYQNYSPYLYPFSVEYSILVVGIIYIVWVNIGLCAPSQATTEENHHHHGEDTRDCMKARRPSEPESNITIHADCHASNKGLFGGFIILVFAIVSVILFFITYYNESTALAENGLIINQSTNVVIVFLMTFAVIFAYVQMVKLDVNEVAHNTLDNFLCLMCLPAFFVHGIFSIIPGIIFGNTLAVIGILAEIIQITIQTPFIMDGMARSSNTKELRKKKPGREFVTFLVICNVAMWIMQTFEVKSHGLDQYRQNFYSKEFWSVVGHMCLPLMMFYRFHSSVCIGDIWKYAYMPSGH